MLRRLCVSVPPALSLSATSSVEELPGIFSGECKVPWNNAQQLNDVGYMVYRGEREKGGRRGRKRREGARRKGNRERRRRREGE